MSKLLLSVFLIAVIVGCTPSVTYDQYSEPGREVYFERHEQQSDLNTRWYQDQDYTDRLVERCIEGTYENFYDENELIAYCEDNAYDYDYEPNLDSDYFDYEADFDDFESYVGPRGG